MPKRIPDAIKSFNINLSDAAAQRPVLAIEAARIFALWANVEHVLATMTSLLITDASAQTLLDRFKSRHQQLDAVQAAAAEKISHRETRDLLKPLFKLINRAATPRNELAHCLWGTIDDLPNALLLTQPEVALRFARQGLRYEGARSIAGAIGDDVTFNHNADIPPDNGVALQQELRDGTAVWEQADFDVPRQLLYRSVAALTTYMVAIGGEADHPAASQARQQLRQILRDAEALA